MLAELHHALSHSMLGDRIPGLAILVQGQGYARALIGLSLEPS